MLRKLLVVAAAMLPLAGGHLGAADVRVVEQIIAKVNGEIVTMGDLAEGRKNVEEEMRQRGATGAQLTQAVNANSKDLLRDKIDELLLIQRGTELDIKVDPEVTRYVAGIQLRSGITDPDKFGAFVLQTFGVPLEELKQKERNKLLAERVIGGEVGARIFVPESEMKKYYDEHPDKFLRQEEVFLSQILISTEHKTAEQVAAAEKKAKELVTRLRQGEKFSDLAVTNSDDTQTSRDGGYIGGWKRADLVPTIANLVFSLKKGAVTDPIKLDSPPGFLILKVEERHEAGQATFDEVHDEIHDAIIQPQIEPKLRDFLTKLREDALIQIRAGYVDTGGVPDKDTLWQEAEELKPQTTTKAEVQARQWKKIFGFIPYARVGPPKPGEATATAGDASKASGAASASATAVDNPEEATPLRRRRLLGFIPMGAPVEMKPDAAAGAAPAQPAPPSSPQAAPKPTPDKQ